MCVYLCVYLICRSWVKVVMVVPWELLCARLVAMGITLAGAGCEIIMVLYSGVGRAPCDAC